MISKKKISWQALLLPMIWLAGPGSSTTAAAPAPDAEPSATANAAAWPASRSPRAITDRATETAISELLRRMTLEQKVGQLIQADIGSITPQDLEKYPLGSILAGGNSGPYGDERADAATWHRLVEEFRAVSLRSGAGIPILFGVDAVHGHSNLPGATIFPHNIGLGAAHDPELVRRIGAATAAEVAASGIEWTFAPTLAVPQDLRWGRSYEGYAADPRLVAAYARAMTLGLQGPLGSGKPVGASRVAATAKHFLADGGTREGRDQGDARLAEEALVSRHAAGYPAAIEAGALTVMASFSSWNGVKHHGNASLLTDVLKGRMGFAGLVVGDWNAHGQVPGCTVTHCPQSLNAGIDLYMAPESWRGLFASTLADVRAGRIRQSRVDDAVRRILRVKFKLGLMGKAKVTRGGTHAFGAGEHRALAREAAAKSLVLLKNEGAVLPLKPGLKVLVAGPGADDMAMQAGGWTITWQGTDTKRADFPDGQTIGEALAAAVRAGGGFAAVSPRGETPADMRGRPDVAVLVTGERPYAEFQGDLPHLAFLPQAGEAELVRRWRAEGVRVVVVFLSGRPLFVPGLMNQADAFVAAWLPGTQGAGVADVLVAAPDGRVAKDFTGRLPFPWPKDARSPIVEPLFAAGEGLDYAHPRSIGQVPEEPGVDIAALSDTSVFLRLGAVPAPWYLATDGMVATRTIDLSAQEDAREFRWTGPGKFSIEGAPIDLATRAAAGEALVIDWRIDGRSALPVVLSLGGGRLDFSAGMRDAPQGVPTRTRIPLRCFAEAGANLAEVGGALRVDAGEGLSLRIRSALIGAGDASQACPPAAR
jgi:beta-glucosidase